MPLESCRLVLTRKRFTELGDNIGNESKSVPSGGGTCLLTLGVSGSQLISEVGKNGLHNLFDVLADFCAVRG